MEEKTKNNKKRKLIIVIIILLMLVTGISYAAFTYNFKGTESLINVKPVELELLESTGEIINIQNAFPMTDEQGIAQSETFDFAVTTRTEAVTDIFYSLKIEKVSVDSGFTSLQDSDVKIYLTDFNNKALIGPRKISNLTDNIFYESYNSHTSEGTEVTTKFKLRSWIDEDVDAKNWDMNTKLQYKFKIGVEGKEYKSSLVNLSQGSSIPKGAYYISMNMETGEPTIQDELPETLNEYDIYLYGDYIYVYSGEEIGGWMVGLATTEYFEMLGLTETLSDYPVTDRNQTTYGPILENINGQPVTNMNYTFQGCTSLAKIPVIPKSVISTEGIFERVTSLKSDTNIYSINTDVINLGINLDSITNYTTDYKSLNSNSFLKHNIGSLGRVESSDVCYILNGNKYCLKGGGVYDAETESYNSLYYEENKSLLLETFGEDNCSVDSNRVNCSLSGLYANAHDNGNVNASDFDWHCNVSSTGNAYCY